MAQAALEAEEERGSTAQDETAAEMQPILSRHAVAAGSRTQQRVQKLDWIRACSDVEPLPGMHTDIPNIGIVCGALVSLNLDFLVDATASLF